MTLVEYHQGLAHLSMKDRLLAYAIESENLAELAVHDTNIDSFLWSIHLDKYEEAKCKARRDYEPPDPPGWEGGFADNH